MQRFSDFSDCRPLDGDKISINDLLNQEIAVLGYKVAESKKRKDTKCITIQIEFNGQRRICFTGSGVLLDQLEHYKDHIPFLTVIKKVDKYYTFS